MTEPTKDLCSLETYQTLTPEQQGYVAYMEAAWPESEISDENPYPPKSKESEGWNEGAQIAVIEVQDDP